MKRLVTLSAIALAGATLGVGTTFGWWADDPNEKSSDATLGPVKKELAEPIVNDVEIVFDQSAADGKKPEAVIIDANKAGPAGKVEISKGLRLDVDGNSAGLERLSVQLEVEAKQMEAQGHKESAEIQRKLAQRLREFIKSRANSKRLALTRTEPEVEGGVLIFKDTGTVSADLPKVKKPVPDQPKKESEPIAVDVLIQRDTGDVFTLSANDVALKDPTVPQHKAAANRIEQAKALKLKIAQNAAAVVATDDVKVKQQLDAEVAMLHAKLQQLLAQQAAELERNAAKDAEARKARTEKHEQAFSRQVKAGHFDGIVRELTEVAAQLEKVGRKAEADAVRKQAERIVGGSSDASVTITLGDDGQITASNVHSFEQKIVKLPDEKMAVVQIRKSQEAMARAEAEARARAEEIHARIQKQAGSNLGEVHQMLRELRHEIGELREEVRGLRGLLSSDHRKHDRDEDDDDDDAPKKKPQEKEGAKSKIRHRDAEKSDGDKKSADQERDDDDDAAETEDKQLEDSDEADEEARATEAQGSFSFFTGFQR